ncbi:hypothetical protein B0H13DRAFT_1859410 [Mycena leptocephala]|nr:hypothetical protein B0H13DRAFT_1859410 [Mycena leptocephala]
MSILGDVAPHSESRTSTSSGRAVPQAQLYGTPRPTHGLRTLRVDIIRKASSMNGRAARRTFNVPTETPRPNSASAPPRRVDLLSRALWEQRAFDSHHPPRTRGRGSKRNAIEVA